VLIENKNLNYLTGGLAAEFTPSGGNGDWKTIDEDFSDFSFTTFVKLHANASPLKIGQEFSSAYKKARNGDSDASFHLQSLASIHLVSADGNNSPLRMVQIFYSRNRFIIGYCWYQLCKSFHRAFIDSCKGSEHPENSGRSKTPAIFSVYCRNLCAFFIFLAEKKFNRLIVIDFDE
jgi:hypothetical protein